MAEEEGAGRYAYYFDAQRPAFVARLIARKHELFHELATRGRVVGSVLEIGPGDGWFARACLRVPGRSYLALESSPVGTQRLRAAGVPVREATVPPLPRDLDPVDLVYASHLIEHLPGPDAALAFVRDAVALLRPGGALALAFPDASRIGVDFWDCDYTHQWPSTPRRVRQLARDAGLDVVATHHRTLLWAGWRAAILRVLVRGYPARLLAAAMPEREDFFYRGKMLLAPDVLMLLERRGR